MTYQQVLDFLFSQLPVYQRDGKAAYKANLDNTNALDDHFNQPHQNYLTIHVAGTNGKGSVSHMLASVLQQAGYKVGLYTSPHLKDFRERIKINGQMISEDAVISFVEQNKEIIKNLKPSFFEMTVALAFEYFSNEKVDIAVIEVGMGGRLDSTNIISPLVSVITNIGLDHTAFLGDNLKAIAGEKASIIKAGIPAVVGEWDAETASVFLSKALQSNTSVVFADKVRKLQVNNKNNGPFTVEFNSQPEFLNISLDLLGDYQKKNLFTTITTLQIVRDQLDISTEDIINGLSNVIANTGLKGRWQIISDAPKVICDTGHNKEGLSYIVNQLKNENFEKLHIVWGMVNDKDIDSVLELLPKTAKYYFTKASIPRALNEITLMRQAKTVGLQGSAYANVELALKKAKEAANENDIIFIGGSTFVVAEIPNL